MMTVGQIEANPRLAEITIADLEADNYRLRTALRRARSWGISGKAYDAGASLALAKWVDAGMKGDLPAMNAALESEI
jgi:hypothetical protein